MNSELLSRQEEGKILKREDQLTDISQLPESILTGQPTSDLKDRVKFQSYAHEESPEKGSTMGSLSIDNIHNTPAEESGARSTALPQGEASSSVKSPITKKIGSLEYLGSAEKNLADSKITELKEKARTEISHLQEGYQNISSRISDKIEVTKDRLAEFSLKEVPEKIKTQILTKGRELKQEASEKYTEIKHQMEQKEAEVRQQAEELSKKASEKVNEAKEQLEKDTRQQSFPKESNRSDQMRTKVEEKGAEIKQQAQEFSEKAGEKIEQVKQQFNTNRDQFKQEAQNLSEKIKHQAEGVKQHVVEKTQDFKQEGQKVLEDNTHSNHHLSTESPSFSPNQETHQQHHLSAESQSFRPNQESHVLIEAVKQGLGQQSGNLVEKVNQADEQLKAVEEPNNIQKESAPAITKQWRQYLYQESAKEWNQSIKEGRFELVNQPQIQSREEYTAPSQKSQRPWTNRWSQRRSQPRYQKKNQDKQRFQELQKPQEGSQKHQGLTQKSRQHRQRSYQRRPQYMKIYQVKQTQKQEDQSQSQPNNTIAQEDTNNNQQPISTESELHSQIERERVPLLDVVQNKYQNYKNKISNVVHFFRGDNMEGEEELESKKPEDASRLNAQEAPLKDKIKDSVGGFGDKISGQAENLKDRITQKTNVQSGRVSNLINDQVENAKSKFSKLNEKEPLKEKIVPEESEIHSQSVRERVSSGLHNITSKFAHSLEGVKERFHHNKEQSGSSTKGTDDALSKEAFVGKVKDGLNQASNELSAKVEGVKNRFRGEENDEDSEEFHKVKDGFSETLDELHKEQHVEEYAVPLHSDNPFNALIGERNLVQPLRSSEIVGGNVQELADGIKDEDLIHREEVLEEAQSKTGILGKISANLSNISHKITAKLPENIKHPFASSEKIDKENSEEYL